MIRWQSLFQVRLNTTYHPGRNVTPLGTGTASLTEPTVVATEMANLPIGSLGVMAREINPVSIPWFLDPYNLSIWETENKMAVYHIYCVLKEHILNLRSVISTLVSYLCITRATLKLYQACSFQVMRYMIDIPTYHNG